MKRPLLFLLGLLAITSAVAQETPIPVAPPAPPKQSGSTPAEWPGVDYTEVRAYLYNPPETYNNRILLDGKLHPGVVNPEGIKLDAARIKQLLQAISHREPDRSGSGCFLPHHDIVFYDRDGKAVADLSICFLCTRAEGRPYDETMRWDLPALSQLVQDLGLPVFRDREEADAHFSNLARQWPEDKVNAALDQYIFSKFKEGPLQDDVRTQLLAEEDLLRRLLQGMGERTHPVLLAYLADKNLRAKWSETDPAHPFPSSRFHRLCDAFGDTPPAGAIPLLAPFLEEADASARCDAAETIAKTGAPESVAVVRRAFADSADYVPLSAFEGLLVANHRGALHADTKAQLFPLVRDLDDESIEEEPWAKALIDLDSNKAMEFFLSREIFKAGSPRLASILTTLCELNLQIPRERIIALVADLRAAGLDREQLQIMKPALLLLGRRRNPDDLKLLSRMGEENFTRCAMPGLLAWHGLEGYHDRLSKQEREKGFASLNEAQRLHFATSEFESSAMFESYFFGYGGARWRDALAGLKVMKRDKAAALLEEAVAKFGAEGPSSDGETRRTQIKSLHENHSLDELNQRLKEAHDYWDLSLDRFAIEHAESFQ